MARVLQIDFKILGGEMESYRNSVLGSVIINISEQNLEAVTQYLNEHKVFWKFIDPSEVISDNVKGGENNIEGSILENVVEVF